MMTEIILIAMAAYCGSIWLGSYALGRGWLLTKGHELPKVLKLYALPYAMIAAAPVHFEEKGTRHKQIAERMEGGE